MFFQTGLFNFCLMRQNTPYIDKTNRCESLKGQNKVRESKQPQDCNENRADPTATNITVRLAKLHAYAEASKLTAQITRTY